VFLMDDDRLHQILREWEAPAPAAKMDDCICAAWRTAHPPAWRRLWSTRISVPVPVLAGLLLLAVALFVSLRRAPPARQEIGRYVTRLNATGFQPAPNGEARVVKIEEMKQ
jgi:hypothetical protein